MASSSNIAAESLFVMGKRDPFIPAQSSAALLKAIKKWVPKARVMSLNAGHVRTMVLSARYQYAMAGIERPRTWFELLPQRLLAQALPPSAAIEP